MACTVNPAIGRHGMGITPFSDVDQESDGAADPITITRPASRHHGVVESLVSVTSVTPASTVPASGARITVGHTP